MDVDIDKSHFGVKYVYVENGRLDIFARGFEKALNSMGINIEVRYSKIVDDMGIDRAQFELKYKEKEN